MVGGWAKLGRVLAAAAMLAVGACDNPPPRPERKLPIPKGESTLDDLIRKSQAKPASPPAPARIEAVPVSVDFGAVGVGEVAVRQVRLTNNGESPAGLGQIHVAGQASAFRLGGGCAAGDQLAPGQSCALEMTFRPAREGSADAELVVGHNAAGGSSFVSLTGEGRARERPPTAMPSANAEASLLFARSRQEGGLAVLGGGMETRPGRSLSQPDYVEAGLPGIVSTFPVDRTRVITADRYIPAVLENTINSELAGRAIAVVERNVYGAEGRTVLIPAGSRAIGQYRSLAKAGQARLDIDWSRIVRPDGVSINIDNPSSDVMGRAGIPGELDSRFVEKYGGSLLTSTIAAAGDWAMGGNSSTIYGPLGGTTQSMSGRARAGTRLGNDLDQLGIRMVQENMDIRPVLTVAQGTRLNIIPAEDIWLRDPDRLQAVTPPKANSPRAALAKADNLSQLIPGLVDVVVQNPMLQKMAPQTAQQIMQSAILQQLRSGNYPLTGTGESPADPTRPKP